MAIIQLPRQQSLGGAIGMEVGSGINQLVNMKLENLAREQRQKSAEQSLLGLGFSPQSAATYAALGAENPQLLNTIIKEGLQAPSQRFYEGILAGETPDMPAPTGLQQLQAGIEPQVPISPIQAPIDVEMPGVEPTVSPVEETIVPVEKPLRKPAEATKLSTDIDRMRSAIASGRLRPKHVDQLSKLITQKEDTLSKLVISEKKEKASERRFERKIKLQEEKMDLATVKFKSEEAARGRKEKVDKQDKIDKEHKPDLKKWGTKAEASLMDKARFNEMKRINEEGELGSNAFNIFVDALEHGLWGLGVNLSSLQTADAQSLKKLSKDFVKNVKEIIGTSRITQSEVMLYLSTIPNLMQSPEGRARIIDTNLALGELAVKKYEIANDIVKKNKDMIPANFSAKVFKRMKPELEKFENQILSVAKRVKQNMKVQQRQKEHFTFKDILDYAGRNLRSAPPVAEPGEKPKPQRSPGLRGYFEDIVSYGSRNV